MIYKHKITKRIEDFRAVIKDEKIVDELLIIADIFEEIATGRKNALETYQNYVNKILSAMYKNYPTDDMQRRHMLIFAQFKYQTKIDGYLLLMSYASENINLKLESVRVKNPKFTNEMKEAFSLYRLYVQTIDIKKRKYMDLIESAIEVLDNELSDEQTK